MGYFSERALERAYDRDDFAADAAVWRVEDLRHRREELIEEGAPYRGWTRWTDEDLGAAVPESLETVGDVDRAIELAMEELAEVYGAEKGVAAEPWAVADVIPMPSRPRKAA